MRHIFCLLVIMFASRQGLCASEIAEVISKTPTRMVEKIHPRTGQKYRTIIPDSAENIQSSLGQKQIYSRPNYEMLKLKSKSNDFGYDGPTNDRTKVYVFAATVTTVGVAGGAVGMLSAASAATTASSAAGGAGVYAAGGAVLTAGSIAGSLQASRVDPETDDFTHTSETKTVEIRSETKY